MRNLTKIFWFMTSYNALIGSKPLYIRFNEINGFSRVYYGTKYLMLFGWEK